MSGFNTKERNSYGEYEITFYTDNHEDFKKVQDLCRELIDHNESVSTEGDLISRSYLKQMMPAPIEDEYKRVHQIIDNVPTVSDRPQGRWVDGYGGEYRCTNCSSHSERMTLYCGCCGADMRGGAK